MAGCACGCQDMARRVFGSSCCAPEPRRGLGQGVRVLRIRRAVGIGWCLIGLALVLSACSTAGPPKEPVELVILHTGQVAGEILPCG